MRLTRWRALLLVLIVGVVVLSLGRRGAGSLASPPRGIPGFHVVYRIEVHAQGTEISRREVDVRRPLDSRDLTYAENGTDPVSGFVSAGTRLYGVNGPSVVDYGDRIAAAAPGDFRFEPILHDLVRLHLARRTARDRVAGRSCDVYRFGEPLGDPIQAPKPGEYADLCIDPAGLVLSERWVFKGKLLRKMQAVSVTTRVPPDALFVAPSGPVTPNPTDVGAVQALPLSKLPSTGLPYWVAPAPPWGFRLTGRSRVVTTSSAGGAPEVTDIAYIDSYTRGPDVIEVVHRELGVAGPAGDGVERVDAGSLGSGAVTLSPAGAAIAFEAGKWLVTVRGALDVAHVRAFSEALRQRR